MARVKKSGPTTARHMNPHPAALPVDVLLQSCSIERTRRSGPGGQHRNKVETAVVITHPGAGVRAEASERRSQAENLSQAIFRLRLQLARHVRSDPHYSPSLLWNDRAATGKISVNSEHDDFPAILAEALDVLCANDWDPVRASEMLRISSSQLIKLLKSDGDALAQLNAARLKHGLHRLT